MRFYILTALLIAILGGVGFILYKEIETADYAEQMCQKRAKGYHSILHDTKPGRIYTNSSLCYDSKTHLVYKF